MGRQYIENYRRLRGLGAEDPTDDLTDILSKAETSELIDTKVAASGFGTGGGVGLDEVLLIQNATSGNDICISLIDKLKFDTDVALVRDSAGYLKITDGATGLGKLIVAQGTPAAPSIQFSDGVSSNYGINRETFDGIDIVHNGQVTFSFKNSVAFCNTQLSIRGNWIRGYKYLPDTLIPSGGLNRFNGFGELKMNTAATGPVDITLTSLAQTGAGAHIRVAVVEPHDLDIIAQPGTNITIDGVTTGLGGFVRSSGVGSTMHLIAVSPSGWVAFTKTGTWAVMA